MDTAAGPRLCVCQDDALFLALVDPHTGRVDSQPLPVGPSGLRLFDTLRGNKLEKLDLESVCVVPTAQGPRLWLFGSGAAAIREVVVEVDPAGPAESIRVRSTARFCANLRADGALRDAPLNLEGACVAGGDLVLLQRGNGAEGSPAVVRVALAELQALLDGRGELAPVPCASIRSSCPPSRASPSASPTPVSSMRRACSSSRRPKRRPT